MQGLAVHTAGGVVTPAETLMNIVPAQDTLIIEARVNPRNIDEVEADKNVHVRFTSFATQSTPEALANIESVSSDVSTDERTGETFYTVRMAMNGQKLPDRVKAKLTAGMPVEVQIETSKRNAMSYLLKPLTDQFSRAFREE